MLLESASGFGLLSIQTNTKGVYNDSVLAHAVGFLEASLTASEIWQQWQNMDAWIKSNFKDGVLPPSFATFFDQQDTWSRGQVATNKSSALWQITGLILSQVCLQARLLYRSTLVFCDFDECCNGPMQFDGLYAGYTAAAPANQQLSLFEMQQLNAVGDLLDLIPALAPQ